MTWAWRRAQQIAEQAGTFRVEESRDFVDRIEAIYAWSQFLIDDATDLPGRQALAKLLVAHSYTFGGEKWETFRDVRRYSTGLIAAVNYGPSLRTMDWIRDLSEIAGSGVNQRGAYKANPQEDSELDEALDQFEAQFSEVLDHPAFNVFGEVVVKREEAERWGHLWDMDEVTQEGQAAAWRRVNSGMNGEIRKRGLQLVRFAATYQTTGINDEEDIRRIMADPGGVTYPDELVPVATAWRRMQVRQVLRLALEGFLTWAQRALSLKPRSTLELARMFVSETGADPQGLSAEAWQFGFEFSKDPIDHLDRLAQALDEEIGFAAAVMSALRFCISEAPAKAEPFERSDRLPLIRAAKDWHSWADLEPLDFIGRLVEQWIFAQHTYWSVGRGIQDARSSGKTILRLRIFIDEGGWRLAHGFNPGGPPNPTPDRLETALSYLSECGQLTREN